MTIRASCFKHGDHDGEQCPKCAAPALCDMTDKQIAGRVRMLLRTDLDHEAVCTFARDRILALSAEVERLRANRPAVVEGLCKEIEDLKIDVVDNAARHALEITAKRAEAARLREENARLREAIKSYRTPPLIVRACMGNKAMADELSQSWTELRAAISPREGDQTEAERLGAELRTAFELVFEFRQALLSCVEVPEGSGFGNVAIGATSRSRQLVDHFGIHHLNKLRDAALSDAKEPTNG